MMCSGGVNARRHRSRHDELGASGDTSNLLTSNRPVDDWGKLLGDTAAVTALLDRLLHHAVVIQIEGSSYRLRQHADLMPEHLRSKAPISSPFPAAVPRRRGRPPKLHPLDQPAG